MKEIVHAVSVVFKSGGEVFSIVRQPYLRTFPGYTAFPGGKVAAEDATAKMGEHPLWEGLDAKLAGACVREVREELGVDLNQWAQQGKILAIQYLGEATTPPFFPYRFQTHFFSFELKDTYPFECDPGEIESAKWYSPQEWLRAFERAEILSVPSIVRLMQALAEGASFPVDLEYPFDLENEVPRLEALKGVVQFMPLSRTFPPANRTNCFLIGDESARRVLIDPSPKGAEEYRKLLRSLRAHLQSVEASSIDLVFLTHHHPDHHEMAPDLARELGVPVGLSRDTKERIDKRWGSDYLQGTQLEFFQAGDELTVSLGSRVKIHSVPGHDRGQLAPAAESKAWFLAGDLIQTIGTVVVGGDEGDMSEYMQSLRRVIDWKPRVVIPSHGTLMGGTHRLKATLEHRLYREEQIKKLLLQNKSREEIFEVLYKGLDPSLKRHALATIDSHIKKIRDES